MLGAMAGFDERDSTSADAPVLAYLAGLDRPIKGYGSDAQGVSTRVSILRSKPACAPRSKCCAARRAAQGVSLPSLPHSVPTSRRGARGVFIQLARFDGAFWPSLREAPRPEGSVRALRGEGFGAEVKRRPRPVPTCRPANDAYYLKAQRVRALTSDDFRRAFSEVDAGQPHDTDSGVCDQRQDQ